MQFFKLEHSKYTYHADFVFYVAILLVSGYLLVVNTKPAQYLVLVIYAAIGLLGWSLIEYLVHRFVLHGLSPFKAWHAEHHRRPTALICAPTFVSAGLITFFIFTPAWLIIGLWDATALTFGVLVGYLFYTVTHHAIHHWRANNTWFKKRKYWHTFHHLSQSEMAKQCSHFGVITGFWDKVFRSNLKVHSET